MRWLSKLYHGAARPCRKFSIQHHRHLRLAASAHRHRRAAHAGGYCEKFISTWRVAPGSASSGKAALATRTAPAASIAVTTTRSPAAPRSSSHRRARARRPRSSERAVSAKWHESRSARPPSHLHGARSALALGSRVEGGGQVDETQNDDSRSRRRLAEQTKNIPRTRARRRCTRPSQARSARARAGRTFQTNGGAWPRRRPRGAIQLSARGARSSTEHDGEVRSILTLAPLDAPPPLAEPRAARDHRASLRFLAVSRR